MLTEPVSSSRTNCRNTSVSARTGAGCAGTSAEAVAIGASATAPAARIGARNFRMGEHLSSRLHVGLPNRRCTVSGRNILARHHIRRLYRQIWPRSRPQNHRCELSQRLETTGV
ncbi:hypothetical protein [Nocardia sp. CA-135398]|uniref:hypothetical protein n=1 Tax=Nocardia sp. CA-135398 TaxID=3239977 RepID=UPI003D972847